MTIVDLHGFILLKLKSDTMVAFTHFINMVKNQFGTSIKAFQSDSGGEFKRVHQMCTTLGIKSRLHVLTKRLS